MKCRLPKKYKYITGDFTKEGYNLFTHLTTTNIYIIDNELGDCPACTTQFIKQDIIKRRCLACHQYIMLRGETLDDVIKAREEQKVYCHDLKIGWPGLKKPILMMDPLDKSVKVFYEP